MPEEIEMSEIRPDSPHRSQSPSLAPGDDKPAITQSSSPTIPSLSIPIVRTASSAQMFIAAGDKHRMNGQHDEAVESYRIGIECALSSCGPWDPMVALLFSSLGTVYCRMGMLREALAMHERDLRVALHSWDDRHPRVAGARYNAGLVCCRMGRYADGLSHLEPALMARSSSLGPNHPAVADTHVCIAGAYAGLKMYAEALDHYEAALKIRSSYAGHSHADDLAIAIAIRNTVPVYRALGQADRAAEQESKAYSILLAQLGPDHPRTIEAANAIQDPPVRPSHSSLTAGSKLADCRLHRLRSVVTPDLISKSPPVSFFGFLSTLFPKFGVPNQVCSSLLINRGP